ncbi:thiamine pyrophosphate-dependent enzyme [Streptosporangium canum]|uniref:thiamine pyrophosphate-dependent enzyme n=1 Tax=Streptosporangium canum TaxID=324952 RepID=UPI0036C4735A
MTADVIAPTTPLFTGDLPEHTRQILDDAPAPGTQCDLGLIPSPGELLSLHQAMLLGRTVESAATNLATQGHLAVYPAARGQEACQVGAAAALRSSDWLFPTYRDSIAVITRGADPAEVLVGFQGLRHLGYDPYTHRTAPLCTPLATHAPHAVGLAHAARYRDDDTVALVLLGEGATSEGDFHAALNFAAVFAAPVVFMIQNNQYAISVPAHRQSAARSFAHKGIGYGVPAERVDGNDILAVLLTVRAAVEQARAGAGPMLIEAVTYRVGPHTSSDDAARYRPAGEADPWQRHDPLERFSAYLHRHGLVTEPAAAAAARSCDAVVDDLRARLMAPTVSDPTDLTAHVYTDPPGHLLAQTAALASEEED